MTIVLDDAGREEAVDIASKMLYPGVRRQEYAEELVALRRVAEAAERFVNEYVPDDRVCDPNCDLCELEVGIRTALRMNIYRALRAAGRLEEKA